MKTWSKAWRTDLILRNTAARMSYCHGGKTWRHNGDLVDEDATAKARQARRLTR